MEINLSSLFLIGLLLVVLIVILVGINRQQQNDVSTTGLVIIPQNAGTVYVYQEPEGPQLIECSCVAPVTPTLVGDMYDYDNTDFWNAASLAYRSDNNTIYISASSDNEGQSVIYPLSLDGFDFGSPTLDTGATPFAFSVPFGSPLQGFAWNSTDQLFYTGRSNGNFYSIDSAGVWSLLADELIYDDSTRGYAVLDNGNMLVGDSPSWGGNQIYEVDPNSGSDPITAIETYSVTYQGDPIEGVTAMARAPDGSIWMAIREDNWSGNDPTPVVVFVPGQTALVQTCFVNNDYHIAAMVFDGQGRLWFMTGGNDDNPTSIYFVDPPPCPDPVVT